MCVEYCTATETSSPRTGFRGCGRGPETGMTIRRAGSAAEDDGAIDRDGSDINRAADDSIGARRAHRWRPWSRSVAAVGYVEAPGVLPRHSGAGWPSVRVRYATVDNIAPLVTRAGGLTLVRARGLKARYSLVELAPRRKGPPTAFVE